ncbi:MAG: polymer-forming cytoskeletal protein [Rhodospirillaceae bacterium]
MFRRKKTTTPSAPEATAGRDTSDRAEPTLAANPRVMPFPARDASLEAVRAPVPGDGLFPERPQQETRPPMTEKLTSPAQIEKRPPLGPQPPSPPSRNPLSHLPHIGEAAARPLYPALPGRERTDRPRPVVEGRKLIVGRDIVLTGSIAACDTLVVEGRVESDITDASVIEVAANGLFQGSAAVEHAEIAGTFEGTLTVNKKLSLARTGRIIGTVRYALLEVEAGGQIQGSAEVLGQDGPPAPAPRQD